MAEQLPKLEQLGHPASSFDMVAIPEEVGASKPDPHFFEVALELLGLPKEDVVVVGNSLSNDIQGALNAGLRCVWLNREPEKEQGPPPGVPTLPHDFEHQERALRRSREQRRA